MTSLAAPPAPRPSPSLRLSDKKRKRKSRRPASNYQPLPISHSRHATPRHVRSSTTLSRTTSRKPFNIERLDLEKVHTRERVNTYPHDAASQHTPRSVVETAWDLNDVALWLRYNKMGVYVGLFRKHAITGASLLSKHLTRDAFVQMGILKMGHVLRLLDALDQLRKQ